MVDISRVEVLEQTLRILHLTDDIADQYDDLYDILRHSLKLLTAELDCDAAFIQYDDAYQDAQTVAVDHRGLIRRNMYGEIGKLSKLIRENSGQVSVSEGIFDDSYLVLLLINDPLKMGHGSTSLPRRKSRESAERAKHSIQRESSPEV